MRMLIILLSVIAIGAASFFGAELYQNSQDKNKLQYDYAEINRVNYGLFNLQLWKEKALDIFTKRISEFRVSPKAYDGLDAQISVFIKQMFDEYLLSGKLVDEIADGFSENSKIPKIFINSLKEQAKEAVQTMDLSKQIPGITKQISREIRKSEPQLRKIMQDELMALVLVDEEDEYVERRTVIYNKYGFDDIDNTKTAIVEKVTTIDERNAQLIKYIIGALLALSLIHI